ncbi:MAG: hypothetical protein CL472_06770 [Acidobacteria bacterium]|nr:hypothetical protein [Acidobacteriota bacterium]
MQVTEEHNLHVTYRGASARERNYALKRIKDVYRALKKVDHWSLQGAPVRLGRIELSRFTRNGNGTATLVFQSSSNASRHLTITTMASNERGLLRHEDAIQIMEEALNALSAPILTPEQISFTDDITDLAAVLYSHVAMGCELSVGPTPQCHTLEIPMSKQMTKNKGKTLHDDIMVSNPKLASLLNQLRSRITPVVQCSISEKSGAFTIILSPYTTYRHYPKPGLFENSFHKPLDPMRAMGLLNQFKAELVASGHA